MKKKSHEDLMNDPLYSRIIYAIEKLIYDQDRAAVATAVAIKDSDAKSAIRKTLGFLKGNPPKQPPKDLREQWTLETAKGLFALSKALKVSDQTTESTFSQCLLAVEDSLKLRREFHGHARGYLDFLKKFIEQQDIVA